MIKGVTKSGFSFEINDNVMDDMEIVDAIAACESENVFTASAGISTLCNKILGSEKKRLYDHVRTEDGRVPPKALETEILEIFDALGEQGKN